MAGAFVGAWAETDPEEALAWTLDHLTGNARVGAMSGAVAGLVKKDRDAAVRLVSELPASREKLEAAAAIADSWAPGYSSNKPMPQPAIEWMEDLDSKSLERVLDRVAWRWMDNDRDGMAEFLTKPEAAVANRRVFASLGSQFAQHDPKGAMAWAQRLPDGRVEVAAESVFRSWHRSQPDEAKAWLESAGDGAAGELARKAARAVLEESAGEG